MEHCKNCGNQEAEGVKFCTSCGSAFITASPDQLSSVPPPVQAAPTVASVASPRVESSSVQSTNEVYKEEPISTGGYFGIMFLLMIPLLNLLLLILWACGGCRKTNKRNFARAALLWTAVGIVFTGVIMLAGGLLFGEQFNMLKDILMKYPELR